MTPARLDFAMIAALLLVLAAPPGATAADGDLMELLPRVSCGSGWRVEGKSQAYDRETLSDRINGEAELYFPYGFDRMAATRYAPQKGSEAGLDVEVYRLGSPLDAFGMFANYRQTDGRSLAAGTESNLSGSQLFMYQDRYFIHIQITGSDATSPDILTECAKTVAALLPGTTVRPTELAVLGRPEIVKGTERYLPQSLLGYDFLNRGLMADVELTGATLQIFTLVGATTESASAAFDSYRAQLAQAKVESGTKDATYLEGVDPLYGPVILLKKGSCLSGALKFNSSQGIRALLGSLCKP